MSDEPSFEPRRTVGFRVGGCGVGAICRFDEMMKNGIRMDGEWKASESRGEGKWRVFEGGLRTCGCWCMCLCGWIEKRRSGCLGRASLGVWGGGGCGWSGVSWTG